MVLLVFVRRAVVLFNMMDQRTIMIHMLDRMAKSFFCFIFFDISAVMARMASTLQKRPEILELSGKIFRRLIRRRRRLLGRMVLFIVIRVMMMMTVIMFLLVVMHEARRWKVVLNLIVKVFIPHKVIFVGNALALVVVADIIALRFSRVLLLLMMEMMLLLRKVILDMTLERGEAVLLLLVLIVVVVAVYVRTNSLWSLRGCSGRRLERQKILMMTNRIYKVVVVTVIIVNIIVNARLGLPSDDPADQIVVVKIVVVVDGVADRIYPALEQFVDFDEFERFFERRKVDGRMEIEGFDGAVVFTKPRILLLLSAVYMA